MRCQKLVESRAVRLCKVLQSRAESWKVLQSRGKSCTLVEIGEHRRNVRMGRGSRRKGASQDLPVTSRGYCKACLKGYS